MTNCTIRDMIMIFSSVQNNKVTAVSVEEVKPGCANNVKTDKLNNILLVHCIATDLGYWTKIVLDLKTQ